MQTLSADLTAFIGIAYDAIVRSHFDLLLFAVGLLGYYILSASRTRMSVPYCGEDAKKLGSETLASEAPVPDEDMEDEQPPQVSVCDTPSFESIPEHNAAEVAESQRLIGELSSYLSTKQFDKACDAFELNFASFFDIEMDEDLEWSLMVAALQCGRLPIARQVFETSQADAAARVLKIQRWWRRASQDVQRSTRAQAVGEVFGRLSHVFNDRFPFEEDDSDAESTVFLGDDDDLMSSSEVDSEWDGNDWSL